MSKVSWLHCDTCGEERYGREESPCMATKNCDGRMYGRGRMAVTSGSIDGITWTQEPLFDVSRYDR